MKKTLKSLSVLIAVFAMVLALVSCAKAYDNAVNDKGYGNGASYTGGAPEKGDSVIDENLENNRKIIKNVNESVQTDKYDEFLSSLNEEIDSLGGYISSANYSGDNYFNEEKLRYAHLTVRIPAASLAEFTEKVDSMAVVTYYNETVQDVTGAYVDVESRIAVLEAEETALLEILKTSTTTSDALSVRTRLLDVQADLASLRAQKNTFDDLVEYSTVTINVSEVRRAVEQNPGFFAEVGGTFSDSLHDVGQGIRSFAVWFLGNILYIFIISVLAVAVAFAVRKLIRRKRSKYAENDMKEAADD